MRPALRAWLASRTEPELAKMNYVEELMKVSTRAVVALDAPRIDVARTPQDVVVGPATAQVELVVFGDLDSLDYIRFAQAFGWVRDTFGDRVRLVFKHLPVIGPGSVRIAEAAACANIQGRFWPFHDRVIVRSGPIDSGQLKQLARDAGLERVAFDGCIDRGETAGLIQGALREAERYAISSSPSFLINGRLAAAPPAFLPAPEFFKRVIEEELQRQSKARPPGR
jgi:NhaA family Na+:H+ antiporter